ncbi:tripartite motif-containing protein 14 [Osmerus eperlanus]|uniref:tripartite motif-containing protein 14 n=1 Tax=Osmerus eperlanus TaxID=29151 RepID=UPI002E103E69
MGNNSSGTLEKTTHESFLCPLCHNVYRNPFTLKCRHCFCKGCIGELWSDSANGPYYCPECQDEYRTLPFERETVKPLKHVWRKYKGSKSSGLINNEEVIVLDVVSGEPVKDSPHSSLSKRLLGKRAASSPAPGQPSDSKRLTMGSQGPTGDGERPTTSSSVILGRAPRSGPSRPSSELSDGSYSMSTISQTVSRALTPTDEPPKATSLPAEHLVLDNPEDATAPLRKNIRPVKESTISVFETKSTAAPPVSTILSAVATPTVKDNVSRSVTDAPREINKTPSPPTATSSPVRPSLPSGVGPVPCHYCPSPRHQQPAVKTCLMCGASMCAEHLRPHLESQVFQSHTLVPPIEDISSWKCLEHQEMTRIYCRQCAVCVCTVCTVIGAHRQHSCISIREAETELREKLKEEMVKLQVAEQALQSRVTELTEKKLSFQAVLREARAAVQQQYGAVREALEQEEHQALLCVSQEESRAVGGLEGQLALLRDSLTTVQRGLHAVEGLADATGVARVQEQAFILEYSKVTKSVDEGQVSVDEFQPPEEVNRARLASLQQWTERRLDSVVISLPDRDPFRLLYGISPSLDPNTAHPKLLLSEENRKVVYTEAPQACPEQEARFSTFPQVLASRALEEGRWYWEVDVPGQLGRWKVGVSEGRIERKGQKDSCRMGFNSFSWCLVSEKGKIEALHDKVNVSVDTGELQRLGVFLDYEDGSLSFYRVAEGGAMTLLHRFQQRFTEPLYPALAVSKTRLTISDLFHTPPSR